MTIPRPPPPDQSAEPHRGDQAVEQFDLVEAGRAWFPQNGLLKMFEPLRVLHYSDERAISDFFDRAEMPVVRLLAEKPSR